MTEWPPGFAFKDVEYERPMLENPTHPSLYIQEDAGHGPAAATAKCAQKITEYWKIAYC